MCFAPLATLAGPPPAFAGRDTEAYVKTPEVRYL